MTRMRIVLSRKGFDSVSGGGPSPVPEDGTMLSLPIPELPGQGYAPGNLEEVNWRKYDDLALDDDIKKHYQLSGKYCHLDPDIRPDLWRCGDNWRAHIFKNFQLERLLKIRKENIHR